MSYLDTTNDYYRQAAEVPDVGLCCTTSPVWKLPGLEIPPRMLEMNYGCGTTVHPRDLVDDPTILYVGVGGGMELLQFAYFSRRPAGVIGVDTVPEMIEASRENLKDAERTNGWFRSEFVRLEEGTALDLPVENDSVDVAAQNCLFNIFKLSELKQALAEMYRVLRPRGRLVLSDPISPVEMPNALREDEVLRAMCVSGSQTYEAYLQALVETGFGTIEVRARRPYRWLDSKRYAIDEPILLESIEVAAIKDPMPADGACVFTGRSAIYLGDEEVFDDGAGHILRRDIPLSVCDKTAGQFEDMNRADLKTTPPTFFYDGGGCC